MGGRGVSAAARLPRNSNRPKGSTMFTITIQIDDVAEGDVTGLAQEIWDNNAADFDAARGDFNLSISKDGFPVDWEPTE
jgi:hypothetical protein